MSDPGRDGDWTWAQVQFETTSKSADEIASAIGVTATMVISRASRYQWTRNHRSTSVNQTAELLLAAKVSKADELRLRYEAVEKVNTAMQAEVLSIHRTDIRAARASCTTLWQELKDDSLEEHPLSLDDKSRIIQRLSTSMKTLILLERQAYGISTVIEDPEAPQDKTVSANALDMVLSKFAAVLQTSEPRKAPIILENGSA
jgi:hypothetical protein